ncbi:MAG: DUF4352 domain-containing protein [Firmicutes bacterium]|nr:DUF4352 domain-containing protein [Bacillota bacterium]
MIFKKPYAFLIKYFKLINLILAMLSVYIAYRTYNIITFFNEYISHDYSGNYYVGFSNTYISPFVYLIIILIILGILVICALFIYKKKPIKAYLSSLIYYIVFLILLNIFKNLMITLENDVITAEAARIYRDLSLISIVPQAFFILLFLMRGFGLNLGKFNFAADLKELEISEQDSEEVEINFKKDDLKVKRTLRRFIREFGYYIKENKFIFLIICLSLLIAIFFITYKALPKIIDQEYKQGEIFSIGDLTYKIEDSIITNLNYNGDTLGENTYYIVARLYIENNSNEDINIDYNSFRLIINDKSFYPSIDKGTNFIDYAVNYYGNTIKSKSKRLYSLVYKISDKDVLESYQIKIDNGTIVQNNMIKSKYNYITITPILINKVSLEKTISIGEELSFVTSNLGNTTLTLSNPVITEKYIYDYEYCSNNICNTYKDLININYTKNEKTLIILDYSYNIDKETPYYEHSSTVNEFAKSFIKIKYIDNGEIKYDSINNVTPANLKNKLVLESTNKIKNSQELYLSITIRNKEYLINLK